MATGKWWYCDVCGFANHPRNPVQYSGNQKINAGCEQCGAPQLDGIDYKPEGA